MLEDPSKTLFVGWHGTSGATHYRSIIPAVAMGAELAVFNSEGTGVQRIGSNMEHDIIVLQHSWTQWQRRIAANVRKTGAFCIINVDDWIPAIANMGENHALSRDFDWNEITKAWFQTLREADGVLCSTPWLVERCSKLNRNVALARNGLDLDRYQRWHRPKDDDRVILGWAGGTGHRGALKSIVEPVSEALREHDDLFLHLVGDSNIDLFPPDVTNKITQFGWEDKLFYPSKLAAFHINLAPAQENDFFRAKSQLRFYEACAMGTPTIGHHMYDEIDDGWNGFIATDWNIEINTLMNQRIHIEEMARRALEYSQEISIESRISEWKSALTQLTST